MPPAKVETVVIGAGLPVARPRLDLGPRGLSRDLPGGSGRPGFAVQRGGFSCGLPGRFCLEGVCYTPLNRLAGQGRPGVFRAGTGLSPQGLAGLGARPGALGCRFLNSGGWTAALLSFLDDSTRGSISWLNQQLLFILSL